MTDEEKFRELQDLLSKVYQNDDDAIWVVGIGTMPNKLEDENLVAWLQKRAKELGDKYIS